VTTIYGLADPRTQQLRYIGKTCGRLEHRVGRHIYAARTERNHRANWIRSLTKLGLKPEAFVIEEVEGDGCEAEVHHIAQFRSIGCDLVNGTVGGEGMPGYRHTAEARARIAASKLGTKLSPERVELTASKLRGRKHSEEHKAKIGEASRGRLHGDAAKEKIGAVHRGKPKSESHRAKISASLTGRVRGPLSAETRAKISEKKRARDALKAASK
jgi:hypothetical protein